MYEAADHTGICKIKIHPENPNFELLEVFKTLEFLRPKWIDVNERIVEIGKACHIALTPNIKIPLHIYNEALHNPKKVYL